MTVDELDAYHRAHCLGADPDGTSHRCVCPPAADTGPVTVGELRALIVARREMANKASKDRIHNAVFRDFGCLSSDVLFVAANDPATVIRNCDEDMAMLNVAVREPRSRYDVALMLRQSIARRYGKELTRAAMRDQSSR